MKKGPAPVEHRGMNAMPDYVWILIVLAAWFALTRWILPAFGVPT
ncbi:MAG: hypothetical protein H6Q05_2612 [Acidobacteria bacterium]|jgi:hypothetical protein|nr:hypothetical protein [Acidobacteriota bacterium]